MGVFLFILFPFLLMDSFQFSPEYKAEARESFMKHASPSFISPSSCAFAPQEESPDPASQSLAQPLSQLEKRMLDFAAVAEAMDTNAEQRVVHTLHRQRLEILRHLGSNSETTSAIRESVAHRFESANCSFWRNYCDALKIHC